jgi:DNA repair protein RecN (Recombination protein N)
MLRRLTIENYYLIAKAEIDFAQRATMFTGETGSGKTMVLGALAFVLGERAAADVVRPGASRAAVGLEFDAGDALRRRLHEDGYPLDDDENAIVVRELADGKSSMRLNGRATTAAYVREIAPQIADMVGQHEAQRLLAPAYHLEMLDRFGGAVALAARDRVAEAYARKHDAAQALAAFDLDERRAQEQAAFAEFALNEIRGAAPQDGEDERLAARRNVLDNAEKIALALRSAHDVLAGDDAAADALGSAFSALDQIARIGATFEEMSRKARALQEEVSDLAVRISREADDLEFDAGELETINARLDALDGLKRKYGGTIASVLQSAQSFADTLDLSANKDRRKSELERELAGASKRLEQAAGELTRLRVAAAARLRKAVEAELQDVALANARFDVHFETLKEPRASGAQDVEFLFAANKGETPKRLGKGASGGELSRVLLALVVALADAHGSTAMIFDEIDAGIGGATAAAVGVRLARLASAAQVVCVTHLAQIASWSQAHYVLEKRESKSGTLIEVRSLQSAGDRAAEIARMLSGETHDAAMKHARTLLAQSGATGTAV